MKVFLANVLVCVRLAIAVVVTAMMLVVLLAVDGASVASYLPVVAFAMMAIASVTNIADYQLLPLGSEQANIRFWRQVADSACQVVAAVYLVLFPASPLTMGGRVFVLGGMALSWFYQFRWSASSTYQQQTWSTALGRFMPLALMAIVGIGGELGWGWVAVQFAAVVYVIKYWDNAIWYG